MVLYMLQYDLRPERAEDYQPWALAAVGRSMQVGGVGDVRSYRPITGEREIAVTWEFASLPDWTRWYGDPAIQRILRELRAYAVNIRPDLWGPSPLNP